MADTRWIRQKNEATIPQLVLDPSPVNGLRPDRLLGLADGIEAAEAAVHVRPIVISSALRVFSAGLDLKTARNFDASDQAAIVEGLNVGDLRLFACPKPVIVAVNGAAIAGGLFFVLGADHRLSSPRATFGLAEVRVGVDFPVGPMESARAMLAPNDLRRLTMRGQPIGAEDARDAGLIDRLVPEEDLITAAMQDAAEFGAIPAAAYSAVKRQIRGETVARIKTQMGQPRADWFMSGTREAMTAMLGG